MGKPNSQISDLEKNNVKLSQEVRVTTMGYKQMHSFLSSSGAESK
jgi:hypothetical protein